MENIEKVRKHLIDNRLMRSDEETEVFGKAMNDLNKTNNLENIKYYCEAFDDRTQQPDVMFGMIHGIENYDKIFSAKKATEKLISSARYFNNNSKDWQEVIYLRIINDSNSRGLLKTILEKCNDSEAKEIIIHILQRLIDRNKAKFAENVNDVLSK